MKADEALDIATKAATELGCRFSSFLSVRRVDALDRPESLRELGSIWVIEFLADADEWRAIDGKLIVNVMEKDRSAGVPTLF